jgi:hypothetical protein
MTDLPAPDLRNNLGTWSVPSCLAPAVAQIMCSSYPPEAFDPAFRGQGLETTYFDTPRFALRKARRQRGRYLTVRIRCYQPSDTYALSAKTEGQKFRQEVAGDVARLLLDGGAVPVETWSQHLPADLYARLLELAGDEPFGPVVTVRARRYAVENEMDRLTLDVDVATDTGKRLPANILEFKSTRPGQAPPDGLLALPLRPVKLSKFLWSTLWR